jgi:6,7-dimethyl-8-ribityllumazine synthase
MAPATTIDPTTGRIAFIEARWHKDIVDEARFAFVAELEANGISESRVDVYEVPGSLEIPLQAKLLAQSGRYALIVGAGFVIDGGIYRHDFVASAVIDGIMRVQLETEVPILSVVLTPHRFHEHEPHHEFFMSHFKVKGREAAHACIATLQNMAQIGELRASA